MISPQKCICALYLELPPPSVYNSGWIAEFRGEQLWIACAKGLAKITSLPVVVISPMGSPDRSDDCAAIGCQFYQSSSHGEISSLLDYATLHKIERIVSIHPLAGLGMFQADLLDALLQNHLEKKAQATVVVNIPPPLSAAVMEFEFVARIAILAAQSAVQDIFGAISAIRKLGSAVISEDMPQINVCSAPSAAYHPTILPSFVPWTKPEDLANIDKAFFDSPKHLPDQWHTLRNLTIATLQKRNSGRRQRRAPSRPHKILFASNPSAYSGSEASLVDTAVALQGSDLDLHCLVAAEGLFAARMRDAGVRVHSPNMDLSQGNLPSILWMDRFIDKVRPDLIHCNAAVGLPLLAAAKLRGIPLFQWARLSEPAPLLDHLIAADVITAVSLFAAQKVAKLMVRSDKIEVLYDCIDTVRYSPSTRSLRDIRMELGIKPGDFVVLCIARFEARKRHDVLIHAFSRIAVENPSARLLLVGERDPTSPGTYGQSRALTSLLKLQQNILFLGFQSDVMSYEIAADVVVLCSDAEPLGTAVLESMSLGRPIIVSASGGLVEMISNEISGLHCKPGDYHHLADCLRRLMHDSALRRSLGSGARQKAEADFSMERHRNRIISLYENHFQETT